MSALASVAPWFGSKRLLAPAIVSHFSPHDTFYDLFCGSCSILFAKEPSRQEVASEKNPDVVNLLNMLAGMDTAAQLHHLASLLPLSESYFGKAAARLTGGEGNLFTRAIDFLTVSWQGPSGLAGTTAKPRFAKRNTASGGSTAARWRSVAESIPSWHERLRNVEFRNADAFEILNDVPDREGVVVYVDSPYWHGSRRGGNYAYDMTDEQLYDLAIALQRFNKTQIVVSYYDCQEANECYAGWRKVNLVAPRKLHNTAGGESPTESSGEVLYINTCATECKW